MRLVRNEDYWGKDKDGNKLPYLDEITLKVIKDETVLASALKTGEIDVAYLPNRDVDAFLADPKFDVEKMEGGAIASLLAFNPDVPPMNDINLRRAVAYAINPADINKAVFFGKAIIAESGMWPVNPWVYEPSPVRALYDVQKAKEALAAAGKPNGFELEHRHLEQSAAQQTAEIVRAQLGRVGIKANIEVLTVGPATEKFFAGKASPVFLTSWSRYPGAGLDRIQQFQERRILQRGQAGEPGAGRPDHARRIDLRQGQAEGNLRQDQRYRARPGHLATDALCVTYAAAPKKVQNLKSMLTWDGKMSLKNIWIRQ